jgi:hypothetical protein
MTLWQMHKGAQLAAAMRETHTDEQRRGLVERTWRAVLTTTDEHMRAAELTLSAAEKQRRQRPRPPSPGAPPPASAPSPAGSGGVGGAGVAAPGASVSEQRAASYYALALATQTYAAAASALACEGATPTSSAVISRVTVARADRGHAPTATPPATPQALTASLALAAWGGRS